MKATHSIRNEEAFTSHVITIITQKLLGHKFTVKSAREMKQQSNVSNPPPMAEAVPVTMSQYPAPPQQQYSTPTPIVVQSVPLQHPQNAEPAPICRGCGRAFVRSPGVHEGQAQWFRCDDCNRTTFGNFCVIQ